MRRRTIVAGIVCLLAILPAYLRAVTVSGPSDAPNLLLGDKLLINLSAYRVNAPYTSIALWEREGPARGDMVMFHVPNRGMRGLKRVVALPGDTVEMQENVVVVNGAALAQEPLDRDSFRWVPPVHRIGERVVREAGRYAVAYTPGASPLRNMATVTVPAGQYFVLGDNRDDSNDSRVFGPLDGAHVQGRVMTHLWSERPFAVWPGW
ncbi:MAG: signal peptidase I [Bryobacteraceae bacterium]